MVVCIVSHNTVKLIEVNSTMSAVKNTLEICKIMYIRKARGLCRTEKIGAWSTRQKGLGTSALHCKIHYPIKIVSVGCKIYRNL